MICVDGVLTSSAIRFMSVATIPRKILIHHNDRIDGKKSNNKDSHGRMCRNFME